MLPRLATTTFGDHVSGVVCGRPDPEMAEARAADAAYYVDALFVVSDAPGYIASVKRTETNRDGITESKFQRRSVSRGRSAVPEYAIPELLSGASPQPARIGLVDIRPEAVFGRHLDKRGVCTSLRAIQAVPLGDFAQVCAEHLSTDAASTVNASHRGRTRTGVRAEAPTANLHVIGAGEKIGTAVRANAGDGTLRWHREPHTLGVTTPADLAIGAGFRRVNYTASLRVEVAA